VKTVLKKILSRGAAVLFSAACFVGNAGNFCFSVGPDESVFMNPAYQNPTYQFSEVAPLYGRGVNVLETASPSIFHVDSFVYDTQNQLVIYESDTPDTVRPPMPLRHPAPLQQTSFLGETPTRENTEAVTGVVSGIQLVQGSSRQTVSTTSYPPSSPYYPPSSSYYPSPSPYSPPLVAQAPVFPVDDETVPVSPEPRSTFEANYVTHDELNDILRRQQPLDGFRKGKYTFIPYGYINVSTCYESERTRNGDYALYSLSPDLDGGGHSGFHVDPKSSRLGLKINGPDLTWYCRNIKTSALFEVDFQGNINATRNRPGLMLRRAFVDFTDNDTRLLIGQDWEVISPLVPQSLNYVPGSCAGNLGYRRAQIRLERTRKWNPDFSSIWQFAVCDNVPDDFMPESGITKANSGWPMLQGRVAGSFGRNPHADCLPFTVGVSGHVGEMTNNYALPGVNNMTKYRHETWSANIDLEVPVTKRWKLSGEMYTGTNLASSLGGIMQGIDFYTPGVSGLAPRSAKAVGGWGNINFKMTKKFQLNAGYCVEDMDDILASSLNTSSWIGNARDRNQIIFLNGIYNWTDNFMTGLEVSQWETDWHSYNNATGTITKLEPGQTTRIDFLVRYTF